MVQNCSKKETFHFWDWYKVSNIWYHVNVHFLKPSGRWVILDICIPDALSVFVHICSDCIIVLKKAWKARPTSIFVFRRNYSNFDMFDGICYLFVITSWFTIREQRFRCSFMLWLLNIHLYILALWAFHFLLWILLKIHDSV